MTTARAVSIVRPGAPAPSTPEDRGRHVIVVGAGLGGLAAAVRLRHRGFRVTVLERHAHPGGDGSRLTVRLLQRTYAGILDGIERLGYDVFRARAYVSGPRKLVILGRALWAERPLRATMS